MQFSYKHYQNQAREAQQKAENRRLARQLQSQNATAPVNTFREHKQVVYELRTALSAN